MIPLGVVNQQTLSSAIIEEFVGTEGANLTTLGFTAYSGAATIYTDSNISKQVAKCSTSNTLYAKDYSKSDQIKITCSMNQMNGGSNISGILARVQDATHLWLFGLQYAYSTNPILRIFLRNGAWSNQASATMTGEGPLNIAGNYVEYVVTLNGTTMKLECQPGSTLYSCQVTSSLFQSETDIGIRLDNAVDLIDWLKIEDV